MGGVNLTTNQLSQTNKVRIITRFLLISTLVVFCIETLIMVLLEAYLKLTLPLDILIDGLLLIAVLYPINYFFIVRPLSREIEQHRQTNQALLWSHQVLERFFSIKDRLIAYLDANFNFLRVNQAYAAADEHDPAYYIGKNHFALFPNAENQAIFEAVVRSGKAVTYTDKPFEYANNPERGTTYWDWSLLPIKDADERVVELLLVLNDVTFRKQAQMALAENERRFRAVFNQTFQHMALLDAEGNTLLLNQTMLEFSGLSSQTVTGRPFWELPWWNASADSQADAGETLREAIAQAAQGRVMNCEREIITASGERAILDISFKPLLNDCDHVTLIIYEAHDITARVRSEEALIQSQKEIQRLYQAEIHERERAEILRESMQALSGSLDTHSVLEILLDRLFKLVPYRSAHVLLLEDEDDLAVRFARGEETWDASVRLAGQRFELSDFHLFYKVLASGEYYCVQDAHLTPSETIFQDIPSVASWLAIPLRAGEQVIGLCLLEHECPGFFTPELIQWVVALTRQASFAIHNAWLFEQVRDNRAHLQALAQRLVETQERERQFIARELHDDAGQALTSIMFGLHQLELDSGDQRAVLHHCRELKQATNSVIENLHRLAVNLRPSTLDHLGLAFALRQHVETISAQHHLTIQFETIGTIERLPDDMETAIYRIVQESLTNIVRHAQATRVDVLLERYDDRIIVVVEDNGVGFDPQTPFVDHLGVLGMRERALMLGGRLTIESTPGKGSTVLLEVPWPSVS